MIAGLLGLVGGARTYVFGAIGIAAATAIGLLWLQVSASRDQLAAAKVDIERLTQKTVAQEIVIGAKADAIQELEMVAAEDRARADELASTLAEIRAAKPEEDGPIAPVLKKTLKRIRPK